MNAATKCREMNLRIGDTIDGRDGDGGRILIEAQIGFTHNPRQVVNVAMLKV